MSRTISDRVNIILSLRDKLSNRLTSISAKLNQFAVRAREAGLAMAAGATVLGFGLGSAIKTGIDLDDVLRKVKARLGDVSETDFTQLTNEIKKLGRETSWTTSQVAELAATLARTTGDPLEVQNLLKPMLDFARATDIATDEAVVAVQSLLRAFQLPASEAEHVADVMTYASQESLAGVNDLIEAMKMAGSVSKQFGQSMETTVATMMTMGDQALFGSLPGRQQRRAILQLITNLDKVKELTGKGLTEDGKFRQLPDILEDIYVAAQKLGKEEALQKINEIFGSVAIAPALISGQFADKIRENGKALKYVDGVVAKAAATIDGGAGGSFRRFLSALEAIQLEIYQGLEPAFTVLVEWLSAASRGIALFLRENWQLSVGLFAVTGAMILASIVLLTLGAVMTLASVAVMGLSAALSILSMAMTVTWAAALGPVAAIGVAIGVLIAIIGAVIVATTDWGAAMEELGLRAKYVFQPFIDGYKEVEHLLKSGQIEEAWALTMKALEVAFFRTWDQIFGQKTRVMIAWFKFEIGMMVEKLMLLNQGLRLGANGMDKLGDVLSFQKNPFQAFREMAVEAGVDAANKGRASDALWAETNDAINFWGESLTKKGEEFQAMLTMFSWKRWFGEMAAAADESARLWRKKWGWIFGDQPGGGNSGGGGPKPSEAFKMQSVTGWSPAQVASKLADKLGDIEDQQLAEQKKTNEHLANIEDGVKNFTLWGD